MLRNISRLANPSIIKQIYPNSYYHTPHDYDYCVWNESISPRHRQMPDRSHRKNDCCDEKCSILAAIIQIQFDIAQMKLTLNQLSMKVTKPIPIEKKGSILKDDSCNFPYPPSSESQ